MTMPKRLPLCAFKWVEIIPQFNEDFKKNYHEDSDERWYAMKMICYILKNYMTFIVIYHFTWNDKTWKIEKFAAKQEYVIHIRNLKQALNYGLALK